MSEINEVNLDITDRLRDHEFAIEYVKGLEEAAHKDRARIAELEAALKRMDDAIISDGYTPHSPTPYKRIAELEAALDVSLKNMEGLARASAKAEREACAQIADLRARVFGGELTTPNEQMIVEHIAAAIRARGSK